MFWLTTLTIHYLNLYLTFNVPNQHNLYFGCTGNSFFVFLYLTLQHYIILSIIHAMLNNDWLSQHTLKVF